MAFNAAVPEMSAYNIFLVLLWFLFRLALRWPGPVVKLGVVDQLKRKISRMEKSKRKLKRQIADCSARAAALLKQIEAQAQADRDHQQCTAPVFLDSDEVAQLLEFSRSMVLDVLSGTIGFAERRNAAVSRLYFELFGETDGNMLSQLTDPWKQWAEQLATERNNADQVFTQCLERTRNHGTDLGEPAIPTDVQYHQAPELEAGFDRVLDLVRLRRSLPLSRPDSAADLEPLPQGARKKIPAIALRGGSGDGASYGSTNTVHKPGCPRLAHALRKRSPGIPVEQTPPDQDGNHV